MENEILYVQSSALHNAIADFCDQLDAAEDRGDILACDGIEDAINALEVLKAEVDGKIHRAESESARRAAEFRLAYHLENDTLDLY